jgi:hypothetical protein
MNHDSSAYGLWSLVIINSLVFILFAFGVTHPQTQRDGRRLGRSRPFLSNALRCSRQLEAKRRIWDSQCALDPIPDPDCSTNQRANISSVEIRTFRRKARR